MTLGFAGVEHAPMGLIQMGGRAYDPDQRRFLSPSSTHSRGVIDGDGRCLLRFRIAM
ncbi:hypothetical protein WMF31_12675 [Sorangium sp. So ce1036]|uniref:hypothetical protein n=1 Tax=Sorangium sp. So ce1036 TaxID=3133328 RepID=UPI003F0E272E